MRGDVEGQSRLATAEREGVVERSDRAGAAGGEVRRRQKRLQRQHPALRQGLAREGIVEDEEVVSVEVGAQRLLAEGPERARGPGHAFIGMDILPYPTERGERREAAGVAPGEALQLLHAAALGTMAGASAARRARTAAMVAFR
jgi:hypothetical protein